MIVKDPYGQGYESIEKTKRPGSRVRYSIENHVRHQVLRLRAFKRHTGQRLTVQVAEAIKEGKNLGTCYHCN